MTRLFKKLSRSWQRGRSFITYYPRTFRLIWVAAPRWTSAWIVLLVVQGALPVATVYLTKLLVDTLVVAKQSGQFWSHSSRPLFVLALMVGALLLAQSLQGLAEWVRVAQSEYVQDYIKGLIHDKATKVDMAFFESSDFHDSMERARGEAGNRSLALLESSGSLLQNSITLFGMAAVLVTFSWWLPLALLFSTLPALYVILHAEHRYHSWWKESTTQRRWAQYYDYMLTDSNSAPEMRIFNLGEHFQESFKSIRRRLRTERLDHVREQNVGKFGAGLFALLVLGVTMIWMMWRVLNGMGTLGDLAMFYQVVNRGQELMRSLLGGLGKLASNSIFLASLYRFLDMPSMLAHAELPKPMPDIITDGISFEHVTFRYPGSEQIALQDFNLFIPAGCVVAIVGENGAGKTTLLKLLCRFFDPEKGSIKIDGTDLRDFKIEDLWRKLTILFQFPITYHATAAESIAYGDLFSKPKYESIQHAADSAGAHEFIERLPKKYETQLGKWFMDGVQLSGGEYQRVATARAYLRETPLILLDEPTSCLDSWSEVEWFTRFRQLQRGRTAILITHRFTIAMRADIIHVMRDGEIVEAGSHQELLVKDGMYAQSWKAQMEAASANLDNPDDKEFTFRCEVELQTSEPASR